MKRNMHPNSLCNLRTMPPRPAGQRTGTHRITAQVDVLTWWGQMKPLERGRLIALLWARRDEGAGE